MPHPNRLPIIITYADGTTARFDSKYQAAKHYGLDNSQINQYLKHGNPVRFGILKGARVQLATDQTASPE